MKANKILGIFLLVFSAVFNTQLHGQTLEQKLKECSEITVSLIRLQCYDRITEILKFKAQNRSGKGQDCCLDSEDLLRIQMMKKKKMTLKPKSLLMMTLRRHQNQTITLV